MQLRHNSLAPSDQERSSFAALRQDFPEAAVGPGLNGENPNRPFAAHVSDVSVADKPATDLDGLNYRIRPRAAVGQLT